MKTFPVNTALILCLCLASDAFAQGRGPGGRPGGQRFGGPPPNGQQGNQGFGNQAIGGNQVLGGANFGQNLPSTQQLAQMLIARFDADGSGELSQVELQNGLSSVRQMMMGNRGGQNGLQNGANQFGQNLGLNQAGQRPFGNQGNLAAGAPNGRGDRGPQGNRPPPGGPRRAR